MSEDPSDRKIQFIRQFFPWEEKLTELAEACLPEEWSLSKRENKFGVETWRYMRHDTEANTYVYVEIEAVLHLSHHLNAKFVQFSISSERRGVLTSRTLFGDYVTPAQFGDLAELLEEAFFEAEAIVHHHY